MSQTALDPTTVGERKLGSLRRTGREGIETGVSFLRAPILVFTRIPKESNFETYPNESKQSLHQAPLQVMREVNSNPDMRQFVGAGLQMKLLCQLGFIMAAMCPGKSQSSTL